MTAPDSASGAVERLRIDSSGNVGIGNSNPVSSGGYNTLTIGNGTSTGGQLHLENSSGGNFSLWHATTGVNYYAATAVPQIFYTNAQERMRIDSSGTVNIGNSSTPASANVHLDLYCNSSYDAFIRFRDQSGAPGLIGFDHGSNAMQFYTNGSSEAMRIDGSGNVAVGRTSASSRLDLQAASGRTQITLRNVGNTSDASTFVAAEEMTSGNADLIMAARHNVRFFSNLSEKMRIDSSGRLLLNGGTDVRIELGTTGTTGTNDRNHIRGDGSSLKYNTCSSGLHIFEQNGTERMRIDSSGRVLVGTTTANGYTDRLLTVGDASTSNVTAEIRSSSQGQLAFSDSAAQNANSYRGMVGYNHGSNYMYLYTNAAERMRIDSSGNVGIGNSSPAYKLSVLTTGTTDTSLHLATTGGASANGDATNAIRFTGGTNSRWANAKYEAFNHIFHGNGVERMRVDSSGRLFINHTADTSPAGYDSKLQLCDTSYQGSSISVRRDGANSNGPALVFTKSRSTSKGGNTIVQNGDNCGQIRWFATDGTDSNNQLAEIQGIINGTPGSNDLPGALLFKTTSDGATFPVERMRIDSSGNIGIGTTSPSDILHCEKSAGVIKVSSSSDSKYTALYAGDSSNDSAVLWQNGALRFYNTSERMRIDSSGRLLVGTTTEGASNADNLTVADSGNCGITIRSGTSNSGNLYFSDATSGAGEFAGGVLYEHTDNRMMLYTNSAERMRIKSNGNILIGKTTSGDTSVFGIEFYSGSTGGLHITNATSDAGSRVLALNRQSGDGEAIEFRRANTEVGSITVTTSATAYNTSSDYRLKENVNDITDGITRVKQLQPKRFNFIADADTTVDGFLAHEAQTVVPEAVTGTHNEVDDDGNAVMQGIDQSKLVPLLTAALQEAIAKIETLEAKVAALEAA